MYSNSILLFIVFFITTAAFSQKKDVADSLKCTQYFDTLSKRQIYRFPEKDAEFKGGPAGFSNYINRNFSYNNTRIAHQTFLIFTFIVETDGSISNVSLGYPPHDVPNDIIEKGIKVIQKMPKLIPAECNKQKVPVRQSQPIVLYPDRN
jgi:hypothetical protein